MHACCGSLVGELAEALPGEGSGVVVEGHEVQERGGGPVLQWQPLQRLSHPLRLLQHCPCLLPRPRPVRRKPLAPNHTGGLQVRELATKLAETPASAFAWLKHCLIRQPVPASLSLPQHSGDLGGHGQVRATKAVLQIFHCSCR